MDDVVFSCGATIARLSRCGWRVVVATAFTASVPEPTGFALACQVDKGISPDADYMALRRVEDEASVRRLGGSPLWLGMPEAPHRGYDSAQKLFESVADRDLVHEELAQRVGELLRKLSPELIFSPQAVGGHVDHCQLLRAVRELQVAHAGLQRRLLFYREAPYAIREVSVSRERLQSARGSRELVERAVGVECDMQTKLDACALYYTQLGFQFGGERWMRHCLRDFAREEGRRLGLGGPAEAYLGTGEVRAFHRRQ